MGAGQSQNSNPGEVVEKNDIEKLVLMNCKIVY